MTKIILFVIFLQVVFGILAKRKARKNAEEAARNPDGVLGEDVHPSERPTQSTASRRPLGWGGQSDDESEPDWDEHHSEEGERSRPEPRNQMRRLPDEFRRGERAEGRAGDNGEGRDRDEHPGRKGIDTGKAKELGKDLLSQLAKELGLEIPTDHKPAPRPAPAPARPLPAAQTPPAKASATQAAKQSAASAKMAQSRAKDRQTEISRRGDQNSGRRQDAGENTPRRASGYLAATPAEPMAVRLTASATARASLMDVKSLRNSFILKTILDKPLSLAPREPGDM